MDRPTPADPWVAQSYLPGEEISAYAAARAGRLLALQSYRPTYRVGHGAAVAFEAVDAPAVQRFVSGLVARLNWTGQISFDFRRDETGELHVIECNPRVWGSLMYSVWAGVNFIALGCRVARGERLTISVPPSEHVWHQGVAPRRLFKALLHGRSAP